MRDEAHALVDEMVEQFIQLADSDSIEVLKLLARALERLAEHITAVTGK